MDRDGRPVVDPHTEGITDPDRSNLPPGLIQKLNRQDERVTTAFGRRPSDAAALSAQRHGVHIVDISTQYRFDVACGTDRATVEIDRPSCHTPNGVQIVGDEDDRPPLLPKLREPLHALALKGNVSDRQNFVHQEDAGIHVGRLREPQPHVHARGEVFDRRVQKSAHAGKLHNAFQLSVDVPPTQAKD